MKSSQNQHPRQENRRQALLEAAASRFLRHGYSAASMRDIAADAGMQVGSIYYHFPSKASLLTAVHEEGLRRIGEAVAAALEEVRGPWPRMEAACVAHMKVLLDGGDFFQTVMRELPRESDPAWQHLVALRDEYEAIFTSLLADLPLPGGINRHNLRLMLLGAMNYSHTWYRPGAESPNAESPTAIAQDFVRFLSQRLEGDTPPGGEGARTPTPHGDHRENRGKSPAASKRDAARSARPVSNGAISNGAISSDAISSDAISGDQGGGEPR